MKRTALLLASLLLWTTQAFGTEFWGGYDVVSGDRVSIVVRYGESLCEGAALIVQNETRGMQEEGTAVEVARDGGHARVDVLLESGRRTFEISQ